MLIQREVRFPFENFVLYGRVDVDCRSKVGISIWIF